MPLNRWSGVSMYGWLLILDPATYSRRSLMFRWAMLSSKVEGWSPCRSYWYWCDGPYNVPCHVTNLLVISPSSKKLKGKWIQAANGRPVTVGLRFPREGRPFKHREKEFVRPAVHRHTGQTRKGSSSTDTGWESWITPRNVRKGSNWRKTVRVALIRANRCSS